MLKFMTMFACLTVLIDTAYGLRCFQCEAALDWQCRKGSPLRSEVSCGLEHPEFYYFCLKKIVKDTEKKRSQVEYGCDLIGRFAVLNYIPQCSNTDNTTRYQITECRICTTDLCEFDTTTTACFNGPSLLTLLLSFSGMFFLTKVVLQ